MTISRLDCYRTLGLPTTASPTEIAARHRELALKLHPDRNPGISAELRAEKAARLSEVNRAFDYLIKQHHAADHVMWGPRPPDSTPARTRVPGQGEDITGTLDLRFKQWAEGVDYRAPDGSLIRIPAAAPPRTYRIAGAGAPGTSGAPAGDYLLQVRHVGMQGQVILAGHEGFRRAGEMVNLFLVGLAGLWLVVLLVALAWILLRG